MKKINGPEINRLLLLSHINMHKQHWLYDSIGIILAIGLMVFTATH